MRRLRPWFALVFLLSTLGTSWVEWSGMWSKAERSRKGYMHRIEADQGVELWVSKAEYRDLEKGSEIWVGQQLYDVFKVEDEGTGFRVQAIRDDLEKNALLSFYQNQSGSQPWAPTRSIVLPHKHWVAESWGLMAFFPMEEKRVFPAFAEPEYEVYITRESPPPEELRPI